MPQGNLQIQCNPYQITNGIFHRTRKKLTIWKHKRLQIARTILRKKNRTQESHSLTLGYIEKLQLSILYGTGTQLIVIHIVKGFGIVNKAEIDVFLELSCFFDDPEDVSNLTVFPLPFLKAA